MLSIGKNVSSKNIKKGSTNLSLYHSQVFSLLVFRKIGIRKLLNKLIKGIHRESTSSNKSEAFTESMNMDIWVDVY